MKYMNQAKRFGAKAAAAVAGVVLSAASMADTTVDVTPITNLQTQFATISTAVMATIGIVTGGFALFRLIKKGIRSAI